jgi:hypothetical protein
VREPVIVDINSVKTETYLSIGRPGRITSKSFPLDTGVPQVNMDFKWASLSKDYGTPRHKHTFDQIRFQLAGLRQSDDGNMLPGDCAYFPEGVPYGPQQQEEDEIGLILQFPGPSDLPYFTHEELNTARQKLLAEGGTFSGGVYTRVFPDGRKINKDSHQACTEYLIGAEIEFPRPRFGGPVVMRSDHYRWMPDPNLPGVDHKHLGTFGERRTGMRLMRLNPQAKVPAHVQDTAEIMYVIEGSITYDGKTWRGGRTETAGVYMFAPHHSAVKEMSSETGAIIFTISLPMLAEIEREKRGETRSVSAA